MRAAWDPQPEQEAAFARQVPFMMGTNHEEGMDLTASSIRSGPTLTAEEARCIMNANGEEVGAALAELYPLSYGAELSSPGSL